MTETSGTSGTRSRMYYRNNFFHIGHLKTLFDNDKFAKKNNGICYAIIDDRQDTDRISSIQEDFDYLQLSKIKIVSVKREHNRIMEYTTQLIREGYVYIYQCDEKITNPDRILRLITQPRIHFQIRLICNDEEETAIGYTRDTQEGLTTVLLFDYIIKVFDVLLDITDILTTSQSSDVCDVKDIQVSGFFDKRTKIRHRKLSTYHIHNFRYSKRGWDVSDSNPYLLTIKGLKSRHVPLAVLKAFYLHGCQMKNIKIQFLSSLLNKYLFKHSQRSLGVLKPMRVQLENWRPKQTEYVCGPKNAPFSKDIKHYPLSDVIYIDTSDYGIEPGKVNKGRTVQLFYGPAITCTHINLTNHQKPELSANIELQPNADTKKINWISAPWDEQPCQALFYLYNWFYTGFNNIIEPEIVSGYIDRGIFTDLDQVYQIEQQGFFAYDRGLSSTNNIPSFIRVCKI